MRVVTALPKDELGIFKVVSELNLDDTYDCANIRYIRREVANREYYIVRKSGIVVGAMRILDEEDLSLKIDKIAVKKSEQRTGVGRDLIDFAERYCVRKKIPKLWCWSMCDFNAIEFYRKMGFSEQIRLKKQFFGEDCYFFGKVIDFRSH